MIVPVGAGSANTNIKRPRKISSRPVGSSLAMAVAVRYSSVLLMCWHSSRRLSISAMIPSNAHLLYSTSIPQGLHWTIAADRRFNACQDRFMLIGY